MQEFQACVTLSGTRVHLYDMTLFNHTQAKSGEARTRCHSTVRGPFTGRLSRMKLCAMCTLRLTGLTARQMGCEVLE